MNKAFLSVSILAFVFVLLAETGVPMALGAPKDVDLGCDNQNSLQHTELGRFAVAEHNKKANSLLEFDKVVKAKEQVVAGTLYHLTIEATEGGQKHLYEARVWEKPWLNFKELQEFKRIDSPQDDHGSGWRPVPPNDPIVQEAANHAVKTIQQRSNSLAPYELLEILHAKSKIIEEVASFDMLLKLKRGNKEEKFKVALHKNIEGNFLLNHMQQEHS